MLFEISSLRFVTRNPAVHLNDGIARGVGGDRTILRQSHDSHVQKSNPCMIRSRYGRCLEYSQG